MNELTNTETTDEKRRYERFKNNILSLEIARPGIKGIIKSNPTADCLNFSRTGLQFDCTQRLQAGEKLLIDIHVDDVSMRELAAEIVSLKSLDSGLYCYGARFCLESSRMHKDEIYHCLLLIEDKLKSKQLYG